MSDIELNNKINNNSNTTINPLTNGNIVCDEYFNKLKSGDNGKEEVI